VAQEAQIMMDRWQVTDRKIVLDHPRVQFVLDTLERDGVTRPYFYLVSPVDAVNVLALTGDRRVVLTRQYRHPIAQIIYDLPAGRAEPGEAPLEGALRELEEETGYHAGTMIPLAALSAFPGSLKVTMHLFFATDLTPGPQRLDPGEELEVHLRPFDEVYAEVLAGQHIDAALQTAVLIARAKGLA
jgi:ADP-ribose pyrophosphatase